MGVHSLSQQARNSSVEFEGAGEYVVTAGMAKKDLNLLNNLQ